MTQWVWVLAASLLVSAASAKAESSAGIGAPKGAASAAAGGATSASTDSSKTSTARTSKKELRGAASNPDTDGGRVNKRITLEIATKLVDAAVAAATKRQAAISVAVVDTAGLLIAMKRMDGALPASAELCRVKAETVCLFGMPTRDLAAAAAVSSALSRPVALFGGGVPLRSGDQLLGGIGVAGGMPDHDHEIAAAAADAL